MFYSHEVLTSRKYGVATIWLVATLGSRSTLKKVNRKQILDVNVPKACETIIMPNAPLALRLMSNLLYGISKVYNEQCGYVLSDAQNAQNSLRTLLKVVRDAQIDPEAGRTRPENLLLRDDPYFVPDLVPIELDIVNFGISTDLSQISSFMSPQSSQRPGQTKYGVSHYSSDTSFGGPPALSTQANLGIASMADRPSMARLGTVRDDDGFLPEADFGFDAEGNLIDYEPNNSTVEQGVPATPAIGDQSGERAVGDGGDADMLGHFEGGHVGDVAGEPMELELPTIPSDDLGLRESAEPFPRGPYTAADSVEPTSETIIAPIRRKRPVAKAIPLDERTELRNIELLSWNRDYLLNMTLANAEGMKKRARTVAKKSAEYFVTGIGIGGVGLPLASGLTKTISNPLSMFSGHSLLQALGIVVHVPSQKRPRDDIAIESGDSSPKRRRVDDGDVPRGGDHHSEGDIVYAPDYGFPSDDIEIPREARTPTHDLSTAFPWNVSASKRGSAIPTLGSALGAGVGSTGGPSSVAGGTGFELARRGSVAVSASPLPGQTGLSPFREVSSVGVPASINDGMQMDTTLGDDEQFQLYGPAALVDTQTAEDSQWRSRQFDQQTVNFQLFLEEKCQQAGEVTFEELLPSDQNSRIVAAQGLLHILTLASRGIISVVQEEAYDLIHLRVITAI